MQLNRVSAIWTLARVAAELGGDEDWPFDIGRNGTRRRCHLGLRCTNGSAAFTAFGVENLKNIIDIHRADRGLPRLGSDAFYKTDINWIGCTDVVSEYRSLDTFR